MCNNKQKITTRCGFQDKEGNCGYNLPDTLRKCSHITKEEKCGGYIKPYIWDDKFGLMDDYTDRAKEYTQTVIEGVGKDAEVITNAQGGKQSKSPMAMHLLDPEYLYDMAKDAMDAMEYESEHTGCMDIDDEDKDVFYTYSAIAYIAMFMRDVKTNYLDLAMQDIEPEQEKQITRIAKVLQIGADGYEPNNWRLIPQEEHINHALIHLIAHIMGDTQDEHLDHALCRLMMARSTKKSDNFDYCKYVPKVDTVGTTSFL